jgi:hypothetical protein
MLTYEGLTIVFCLVVRLSDAIDLSKITSPYSGSTTGNSNDNTVCDKDLFDDWGNEIEDTRVEGPDQTFLIILEPGKRITIGQTSNTFVSMQALRYGGESPGDVQGTCEYEPMYSGEEYISSTEPGQSRSCDAPTGSSCDTEDEIPGTPLSYTNYGETDVPVYFVVDSPGPNSFFGDDSWYSFDPQEGDFVLAWVIDVPGALPLTPMHVCGVCRTGILAVLTLWCGQYCYFLVFALRNH